MKKLTTLFVALFACGTIATAQDFSRAIVGTFASDSTITVGDTKVQVKQILTFAANGEHTNETTTIVETTETDDWTEKPETSSFGVHITISGVAVLNQNRLTTKYNVDSATAEIILATGIFEDIMDNNASYTDMVRQQFVEQNLVRNEYKITMPDNDTLEMTLLQDDSDVEITNIYKRVK